MFCSVLLFWDIFSAPGSGTVSRLATRGARVTRSAMFFLNIKSLYDFEKMQKQKGAKCNYAPRLVTQDQHSALIGHHPRQPRHPRLGPSLHQRQSRSWKSLARMVKRYGGRSKESLRKKSLNILVKYQTFFLRLP